MKKNEKEIKSPYLDGRREWNERYGSHIKQAFVWRIVALLSIFTTLISVAGLTYVSSKSQIVPYIVSLDRAGRVTGVRKATSSTKINTRTIKYLMANFIKNLRTVYPDAEIMRDQIFEVYRFLDGGSSARAFIDKFYQDHSPFARMQKGKVDVSIESIIVVSTNTWQIDWIESQYDRKGNFTKRVRYRGIMSIAFSEPKTEKDIINNPIGLYVKEISWSEIEGGE